jgi:hypothetical protein
MKRLSSPFTFFNKFIVPAIIIGVGLYVLLMSLFTLAFSNSENPETLRLILFSCLWLAASFLLLYHINFRLKRVSLNEGCLLVSNYAREIKIPLLNIETVKGISHGYWTSVTVRLKEASEFGVKIMFIPGFYYKDVVAELENAVAEVKAAPNKSFNRSGNSIGFMRET